MTRSKFVQTVTDDVWQAVANATTEDFAESYLYGAVVDGGLLEPRTVIAWDALRRERDAVEALKRLGVALRKPESWRDGNGKLSASECYGALSDAPIRPRRKAA